MKRKYQKPVMQIVKVINNRMLCASNVIAMG